MIKAGADEGPRPDGHSVLGDLVNRGSHRHPGRDGEHDPAAAGEGTSRAATIRRLVEAGI